MSRVDEQDRFAGMVAELIQHVRGIGYKVTLGEVYRSSEEARRLHGLGIGAYPSFHTDRLAVDINLFLNGVYLQDGGDYTCIGEWWESKGGSWGGRFSHPDSCHFSLGEGKRA